MTKSAVGPRCRWCGRKLDRKPGAGRPPKYCRHSCRQQAYMARKLAASHGLGDDDVILSRAALEDLQGLLYCLQAAVEDVDGDLEASDAPADVRDALSWLLDNARPLAAVWIEPRTGAEEAGAEEALGAPERPTGHPSA